MTEPSRIRRRLQAGEKVFVYLTEDFLVWAEANWDEEAADCVQAMQRLYRLGKTLLVATVVSCEHPSDPMRLSFRKELSEALGSPLTDEQIKNIYAEATNDFPLAECQDGIYFSKVNVVPDELFDEVVNRLEENPDWDWDSLNVELDIPAIETSLAGENIWIEVIELREYDEDLLTEPCVQEIELAPEADHVLGEQQELARATTLALSYHDGAWHNKATGNIVHAVTPHADDPVAHCPSCAAEVDLSPRSKVYEDLEVLADVEIFMGKPQCCPRCKRPVLEIDYSTDKNGIVHDDIPVSIPTPIGTAKPLPWWKKFFSR